MNWVRMNLRGHGPAKNIATLGYSDGQDVGQGFEHRAVTYAWGKNLAKEKCYAASRPSSGVLENADTDGRKLTNGIIIAPTDYATSGAVQNATAFWDTGEPVTFGAIPCHAARWHWPHNNLIEVKVRDRADYAGLRCPTHKGRRCWFLVAGAFRNQPGTDKETYLAFKSGPNRGHFHGDQLSLHYCADARQGVISTPTSAAESGLPW